MNYEEGAESVMVDEWVERRLKDRAYWLDGISPGLSDRVFNYVAPPQTQYPFIIYQTQAPPRVIRGVGTSTVMVDTLYLVKVISQAESMKPLVPIAGIIDSAMKMAELEQVGNGFVFASVREEGYGLTMQEEGNTFRHLGGVYRIHAQAPAHGDN